MDPDEHESESTSVDGHELNTADITSQRVGRFENELLLNEMSSDNQVNHCNYNIIRVGGSCSGSCG